MLNPPDQKNVKKFTKNVSISLKKYSKCGIVINRVIKTILQIISRREKSANIID